MIQEKVAPVLLATLIALSSLAGTSHAATVQLGGVGDSNFWPFSGIGQVGAFGSGSTHRMQFAYNTTLFTGISGPIEITALSFIAGTQFAFPTTYSNTSLEVNMSSSPLDVAAQSATFSNNVGADAVKVFDSAITMTVNGAGNLATINLTTSFTYNPTLGLDLLIDILPKGTATGQFSGAENNLVRRSFSQTGTTTTTGSDYNGLSAVISYTVVPEPTSALLFGLGILGIALPRRRIK